jgi:hypothetical protein
MAVTFSTTAPCGKFTWTVFWPNCIFLKSLHYTSTHEFHKSG